MLTKYLTVFFVSMVPLIELRGAIPIGVGLGLPLWQVYIISIIGNMLPVPFIFFLARRVLEWGAPVLECLHKALPEVFYDVHLMISNPVKYAPDFAKAGANLITFHLEAVPDAVPETIAAIRAAGCQVGISIKPGTPAEAVYPYLDDLDLVLVMSVEPGFGGQKFMPSALDKLSALRAERDRRGLHTLLEVDGGVNTETGPQCAAAGADWLVTGSALFKAKDPAAVIDTLHGSH